MFRPFLSIKRFRSALGLARYARGNGAKLSQLLIEPFQHAFQVSRDRGLDPASKGTQFLDIEQSALGKMGQFFCIDE